MQTQHFLFENLDELPGAQCTYSLDQEIRVDQHISLTLDWFQVSNSKWEEFDDNQGQNLPMLLRMISSRYIIVAFMTRGFCLRGIYQLS